MAVMTKNSLGLTVYQSRWGFHPCSREAFLHYKELHKRAWDVLQAALKHHRWVRKHPDNRRGPEPLISDFQREAGWGDLGTKKVYQELLEIYRRIRRPAPTPDEVVAIRSVSCWDRLNP